MGTAKIKQEKEKSKTSVLTVRLDPSYTNKLANILEQTGIATASELMRFFLNQYPTFIETRENLKNKERELYRSQRELENLKDALSTIIKVVG